jgi:hypothetical protein
MFVLDIPAERIAREGAANLLRKELSRLDPESVVRLRIMGDHRSPAKTEISTRLLRNFAPPTMNVSVYPG